jgi:hypothetical protein
MERTLLDHEVRREREATPRRALRTSDGSLRRGPRGDADGGDSGGVEEACRGVDVFQALVGGAPAEGDVHAFGRMDDPAMEQALGVADMGDEAAMLLWGRAREQRDVRGRWRAEGEGEGTVRADGEAAAPSDGLSGEVGEGEEAVDAAPRLGGEDESEGLSGARGERGVGGARVGEQAAGERVCAGGAGKGEGGRSAPPAGWAGAPANGL